MTSMQNRIDGHLKKLKVYQFSVCPMPKSMGQRLMLCDEMWLSADEEEINQVPDISDKVAHIYHSIPNQGKQIVDGEQLEIKDHGIIDEVLDYQLFPVFHATFESHLDEFQVQDIDGLDVSLESLVILGWEVHDSGICSASYEGIYPLQTYSDYFYLKEPRTIFPINKFGLFYFFEDTKKYIEQNNEYNPDNAPWKAVAILTTEKALKVLEAIHDEQCGHIKKPYN